MPFISTSLSPRRPRIKISILLASFLMLGAAWAKTDADEEAPKGSERTQLAETQSEIQLPEIFWEKAEIKEGDHVTFAKVIAHLHEKTEGTLLHKDFDITFPLGGGTVDLDHVLSKTKTGSYYLTFLAPTRGEDEVREVFYLSNGRKRKYENSIAGSGCRHLLKLNSKFLDKMEKDPLLLTSFRHLDITMLAGTFIFVSRKKNDVFLSQITFTSSSQPQLLCDANVPGGESHD